MKNSNIAILVVSCDKYSDVWGVFFEAFLKYWPDCTKNIYWGSNYQAFSHERVQPLLIGEDRDYSSNLINMLNRVKEDWVIMWIEDLILCKPVDDLYVNRILSQAIDHNVSYLKLAATYPWSYENSFKGEIFDTLPPNIKYRVGVGLTFWNKQALLEILRPGESAWDIEKRAGFRSSLTSDIYCAWRADIENPPFNYINTIVKGKWNFGVKGFFRSLGFEGI